MTGRQRREQERNRTARRQRPDQQQGKQQEPNELTKNQTGDNPGAGDSKKKEEAANKIADVYKDVWGHLPESLRGEMNAYSREQFMAKYGDFIRQYYATLSEKGRKKGD